jgi:hypothetical protein
MTQYETGASTLAANDLILTVMHDGATYQQRRLMALAHLAGDDQSRTMRDLVNATARRMRREFGSTYPAAAITEAARLLLDGQLRDAIEDAAHRRDTDAPVDINIRRWFDTTYGNSYWSAAVGVPLCNGDELELHLPMEYGYGSQAVSDVVRELVNLGLLPPTPAGTDIEVTDEGYGLKRNLYTGPNGLAFALYGRT